MSLNKKHILMKLINLVLFLRWYYCGDSYYAMFVFSPILKIISSFACKHDNCTKLQSISPLADMNLLRADCRI